MPIKGISDRPRDDIAKEQERKYSFNDFMRHYFPNEWQAQEVAKLTPVERAAKDASGSDKRQEKNAKNRNN